MDKKSITQIGSLPYDNISYAVRYSLDHGIPFLPELPRLGDSMLDYIKKPGKLSCLDEWKGAVRGYDLVKIQCVGPATLVLSRYPEEKAVELAYEHIYREMDGLEAKEVILFLDEPALGQAGFDYRGMWDLLFTSFDVIPGVHVCGNMDWDALFDSGVHIISHDATRYNLAQYPKYRNGKTIAWGIEKAADARDFQEGDILTLPCGMSHLKYSEEDCQVNLDMLVEAYETLRR